MRHRISCSLIILFIVFLLGTAVRCIGLGRNPAGIVDDEADSAYDAYSLIRTGKDQWGVRFPLTSFRGFGDYRLPGYTYLAAPSVAVFGLTPFAVRLPAALFGSFTILLVFWLVRELFHPSSDTLPLLSAFFLSISPWHIGMSRIGLEETTSVCFVTAALVVLLKGRQKPVLIIISAFFFALSLYIYTPNILLVPFLAIAALYFFRDNYKHLRKYLVLGASVFILVIAPMVFTLGNSTATTRTRQVNFTNDTGVTDLVNEKQGRCVSILPRTICRVVFNKYSAFGTRFISNYLNHFSPNLLSIYGTNTQFSILPGRGLLYVADYCLLLVGLIAVFVTPTSGGLFLTVFLLFSAFPDSLTSDGQFGRFFVSYPGWPVFAAMGVLFVLKKFRAHKLLLTVIVCVYSLAFAGFLAEYWIFFPYQYSAYSHFGYESLVGEIQKNMHAYDSVILSSRVNDAKQYIYYLFYTKYDPAHFQSGYGIEKILESNGWVRVKRIQNIEFLPSLPGQTEILHTHALLIGAPSEFPSSIPKTIPAQPIPVEFTVKDKAGHILFEGVDSAKLYPQL